MTHSVTIGLYSKQHKRISLTKLLAELILSNSTEVSGAAGDAEHPLGNADGVQRGTTYILR